MIEFITDLANLNPLIIAILFAIVFAVVLFFRHNFALVACCLGIVFFSSILFTSSGQAVFKQTKNLPTKPEKISCFLAALKSGVPVKSFDKDLSACSYEGKKLG